MGVTADEQPVCMASCDVVDLQGFQFIAGRASIKAMLEHHLANLQGSTLVLLVWDLRPLAELRPSRVPANLDHLAQGRRYSSRVFLENVVIVVPPYPIAAGCSWQSLADGSQEG